MAGYEVKTVQSGAFRKMKYSIRKQFAMIFTGLMTATILLCWFINSTLLGEYYIGNKKKVLKNAYGIVTVLEKGENYTIQRITDARTLTEYIEMWGIFDNGNIFLFRTALEGIKDSVAIANRFLAYVGSAAAMISGGVILIVSRKVTEPILELAKASKRIGANDFSGEDIKTNSQDELGELVHAFNKMKYATGGYIQALEEKRKTLDLLHQEELERLSLEKHLELWH